MALTELNTEELVNRCRKVDQAAQLEIYNRYYKAMYNTALRIVKDTAEAEDIMQEAFLSAFTKLNSLQENKMFGAWLKRIVVNNSLSILKKKSSYHEVDYETVAYVITDDQGIANDDFDNVKVNQVLEKMDELKDNYSTSLSLHLIEGYDYEEICQIMNISYSNCRTLISRAKESLRKKLQPA